MFTELEQLLEKADLITITVAKDGDGLRVNFLPKQKDEGDYSLQPLSLSASAAELDEGFVDAIGRYKRVRNTLSEQMDAFEREAEELRKAEARKVEGKAKKTEKAAAAKPAPAPAPAPDKKAEEAADLSDLF